ncbi:hypothetical protein BP5796_08320 [Coleophoma crateriformis]|uniref:Uncharacterized protein n=1 Tax=Coleophoma crateriformis TaxID=565419 RepID=A0A3D8R7A5_9HELO|nr:hypothetical protein BP5796_08320 [Coleophoma crateriformis]
MSSVTSVSQVEIEKRLALLEAKIDELTTASASYGSAERLEGLADTTVHTLQNTENRNEILEKYVQDLDFKCKIMEIDIDVLNSRYNKIQTDNKDLKEQNDKLSALVNNQQDFIRILQNRVCQLKELGDETEQKIAYLDLSLQVLSKYTLGSFQRYIDTFNMNTHIGIQTISNKLIVLERQVARIEGQEEAVLNVQKSLNEFIQEADSAQKTSQNVKALQMSFDRLSHLYESLFKDSNLSKKRLYDLEQASKAGKSDATMEEFSKQVGTLKQSFDGLWDLYQEQHRQSSRTHERLCDLEQSEDICVATNSQISKLCQDRDTMQFKIQKLDTARKSMYEDLKRLLQADSREAEIQESYEALSINFNDLSVQNKDLQERVEDFEELVDDCPGDISQHLKTNSERGEATRKEKLDTLVQRLVGIMKGTTRGTYPEIDIMQERLEALLVPSEHRDQHIEQLYDSVHNVTALTHDGHDWLTKVSLALLERVTELSQSRLGEI